MEQQESKADPQQLRSEAEKEPSRRGLEEYSDTIRVLKEDKGFSYREIAAWLQQRGLAVDHNAIWRTYSKSLPRRIGTASNERIERNERSRSQESAMPWL
jgi:hypothetical protein